MKRLLVFFLVLLLVFVGTSLLTGCAPTEEEQTKPVEEVQEEQEVVVIINVDPASFDPIYPPQARGIDMRITTHVAQQLFTTDNPERSLQPLLAETGEASADGMTWTIKLREGIFFHDGAPFNAEAVKLNLDRIRFGDAIASRLINDYVEDIEVAGEYLIKLHMKMPMGVMLYNLSDFNTGGMVSPLVLESLGEGESYEFPVGTGPYKFTRWDKGEQIVMEKVEDYWGEPAKIDRLIFKPVPEAGSRAIMLETGEGHVALGLPIPEIQRLENNPNINVDRRPSLQTYFMGLNYSRPPFDNPKVRQAVNYAVDKQAIVDTILQGNATVSTSPVPALSFGYKKVGPYEYNPEKAKQLLEEAGYGDGFSVDLYHTTNVYMMDAMICEAVQAYLAEVGIEVNLITMEMATLMPTIRKPVDESVDDMFALGWTASHPDAHYTVENILHSEKWPPRGGTNNYYKNERVDELIDLAARSSNMAERERYYHEMQELIWKDAPWLFLHNPATTIVHQASLKGLIFNEGLVLWNAYLE